MEKINNLKILTKALGGFGIVLFLLVTTAIVGYIGLSFVGNDFIRYRGLAIQTNQAGRVQANLLQTRLEVKNFIINPDDNNIKKVHEAEHKTQELIKELKDLVRSEEKLNVVKNLSAEMAEYVKHFEEVIAQQKERDLLVIDGLDKIGPQIEKELSAISKSAFANNDPDASYWAGQVLRNLLLARLYATKFLVLNDDASYQRVEYELVDMQKNEKQLISNLQDPKILQIAKKVAQETKEYHDKFKKTYAAINSRNDLIKNQLDVLGVKIAKEIEDLKLDVKKEQDILGPQAIKMVYKAELLMGIISVIGVIFGIIAALIIGLGIANSIKKMASAMGELAGGNKEIDIPDRDLTNEIGHMASAVEVFKENMIKAEELAAQQAEENQQKLVKAEKIQNLINDFRGNSTEMLDALIAAAQEMEASSQTMTALAAQTSSQTMAVSAAANQAGANVQNVSAATEEMSQSIQEISSQIQRSNDGTKRVLQSVEQTQDTMGGLSSTVDRIGGVASIIMEIAEQTNLLALNATIEAARAGDAGKGFAVVANEVKTLANATQNATEEITGIIKEVQEQTLKTSEAVEVIASVIGDVTEATASVAEAMEEQSVTTSEISRNVQEAANGTSDVTRNITEVSEAAQKSGSSAAEVLEAAKSVFERSDVMRKKIDSFLEDIKTA
jgi:methyl-accepting chemotaxis protein